MKNPALERKKSLVKTATRLFKKEGFSGVSVEDIVKASSTSIATFYSFFPAKEEVVCIARNSDLERCGAYYKKLMEDGEFKNHSPLEKLELLLINVMGILNKTGSEFGRIFTQYRLKERNAHSDDSPYLPMVMELLKSGQEQDVIRSDYTGPQLAQMVDSVLMGAYVRWLLHRSGEQMDEVCGEEIRQFCKVLHKSFEHKRFDFNEEWETALHMLIPDPRSGIKQMEQDWLERFLK